MTVPPDFTPEELERECARLQHVEEAAEDLCATWHREAARRLEKVRRMGGGGNSSVTVGSNGLPGATALGGGGGGSSYDPSYDQGYAQAMSDAAAALWELLGGKQRP